MWTGNHKGNVAELMSRQIIAEKKENYNKNKTKGNKYTEKAFIHCSQLCKSLRQKLETKANKLNERQKKETRQKRKVCLGAGWKERPSRINRYKKSRRLKKMSE